MGWVLALVLARPKTFLDAFLQFHEPELKKPISQLSDVGCWQRRHLR